VTRSEVSLVRLSGKARLRDREGLAAVAFDKRTSGQRGGSALGVTRHPAQLVVIEQARHVAHRRREYVPCGDGSWPAISASTAAHGLMTRPLRCAGLSQNSGTRRRPSHPENSAARNDSVRWTVP
jgi:hypothetical protein